MVGASAVSFESPGFACQLHTPDLQARAKTQRDAASTGCA
jgi:hypothetical protein